MWSDLLLWVSPTSVGTQTLQDLLVWMLTHMTEKARNSKWCRLSPVKSWVAWFSSHCRTRAVPSLAVPCSGFSQFPTISASDFHMGSWLCYFHFVAAEGAGLLPSIPASPSQWKKIPPAFRSKWQKPLSIKERPPRVCSTRLTQGHCGRGTRWRGQATHAHHDPPGAGNSMPLIEGIGFAFES